MDPALLSRLDQMQAAYDDLHSQLASPEVASDHKRYAEINKKASELDDVIRAYGAYREVEREATEARELLKDAKAGDEEDFYRATVDESTERMAALEAQLIDLLTPRDPRDERNVIVEARKGAGGDEAALFAGELLRMYQRYAERRGWKVEILDVSESEQGGINEVVFEVKGKGAYSRLKYESGVHRVQRVPATESSGRLHTSTATVAVLPEAEDVEVEIADDELRVDYFRSSGPGGQHVNTTDSAVRITHLPSGIVVSMQTERSQRQNKERAMRVLRAKLQELAEAAAHEQLASERRSQVGTGERAEKIRTYHFQQNRVTDHRVGVTVHNVGQVMDGDIDEIVDALRNGSAE